MDIMDLAYLIVSLTTIGFAFYLVERRMFPEKQIEPSKKKKHTP